jgi:hypothetical protein
LDAVWSAKITPIDNPGNRSADGAGISPKVIFFWRVRAGMRHSSGLTALANKLARIAWTVLMQERSYEARAN